MLVIVGLGNPEKRYAMTRHNMGFIAIDRLAQELGVTFSAKSKFSSEIAKTKWCGEDVILLKPMTYMNLSGEAVVAVLNYFGGEASDLIAVVDDADLPFGELRFREKGGSGGHNGLRSIEECIGTQDYPRLRVGIGRSVGELSHHVLSRFSQAEEQQLDQITEQVYETLYKKISQGEQL